MAIYVKFQMLYETNVANVAMQNDNAIIVVVESISIRYSKNEHIVINMMYQLEGIKMEFAVFVITKIMLPPLEVTRLNCIKNLLG